MSAAPASSVSQATESVVGIAPAQLAELRRRLYRHARRVVRDDELAEDLVQDALVAVIEQFPLYRGHASLETWATAILKHKVADWYRSPAQRRLVLAHLDESSTDLGSDEWPAGADASQAWVATVPGPESAVAQKETMLALELCVGAMSGTAGHALLMHDWQGYSTSEVCERLGISGDHVRTLLHRARKTVRECIRHDWVDCKGKRENDHARVVERKVRHTLVHGA